MRITILSMLMAGLALSCIRPGGNSNTAKQQAGVTSAGANRKVVVEFFTSEGCSSCPPADEYLGDLIRTNPQVVALAFHVDYWNRLGWKDPYSKAKYSGRQRTYSRKLNAQTYTPQMVVNGQYQFVGSKRQAGSRVIEKAGMGAYEVKPEVSRIKASGSLLKFQLDFAGKAAGSTVNVALVESGLQSDVTRGENAGKTLKHDNVVRTFKQLDGDAASGAHSLKIPEEVDLKMAQLIVYVQNKDWQVTGVDLYSLKALENPGNG